MNPVEGGYGDNPSGRAKARLYDLNFLRYYGLVFERKDAATMCPGDAVDQQYPDACPGDAGYSLLPKPVAEGGDLVLLQGGDDADGLDPTKDFNAVYINFDPPSVNLPGFGLSTGVDVKLR